MAPTHTFYHNIYFSIRSYRQLRTKTPIKAGEYTAFSFPNNSTTNRNSHNTRNANSSKVSHPIWESFQENNIWCEVDIFSRASSGTSKVILKCDAVSEPNLQMLPGNCILRGNGSTSENMNVVYRNCSTACVYYISLLFFFFFFPAGCCHC